MDKQNNIVKLIFILAFMIVGVVGMLKFGVGSDDNHGRTTEHHGITTESYITTTESTEETSGDISSHLIVPETMGGEWLEGEISIPRTLEVGEDGTITITEPVALLDEDEADVEKRAKLKEEAMNSTGVYPLSAHGNEDGSATFVFDEENLNRYLDNIEYLFNQAIFKSGCEISINEEYNELVIYIDEETDPMLEHGRTMIEMVTYMVYLQIYTIIPYDEWEVSVLTVYKDTEEIMLENKFGAGEEDFVITNEDWQQMFENLDKNSTEEPMPEQGEVDR